jgi:Icc-related predicted phosphoesterase
LRIVCISDVHGKINEVTLPAGDVLVMAGDILKNFSRNPDTDALLQEESLKLLDTAVAKCGFKHTLFIAGNHDWIGERNRSAFKGLKFIKQLCDEAITIEGITFYGSSWQPEFCNWAFNLPRCGRRLEQAWNAIPVNTDVLITHTPPYGIRDQVDYGNGRELSDHLGCELLTERLKQLKLKVHVFGHIHSGYGVTKLGETTYVNAAVCNESYRPVNAPIIVEV